MEGRAQVGQRCQSGCHKQTHLWKASEHSGPGRLLPSAEKAQLSRPRAAHKSSLQGPPPRGGRAEQGPSSAHTERLWFCLQSLSKTRTRGRSSDLSPTSQGRKDTLPEKEKTAQGQVPALRGRPRAEGLVHVDTEAPRGGQTLLAIDPGHVLRQPVSSLVLPHPTPTGRPPASQLLRCRVHYCPGCPAALLLNQSDCWKTLLALHPLTPRAHAERVSWLRGSPEGIFPSGIHLLAAEPNLLVTRLQLGDPPGLPRACSGLAVSPPTSEGQEMPPVRCLRGQRNLS